MAADATVPADFTQLGQYGVLGLAVLALGWMVWRMWVRETARGDRLEEQNRDLNLIMQDKVIPALLSATTAMTECTELLREQQIERRRDYVRRRDGGPE